MMNLLAYDFDKTLIPYDSFRRYLWHLMSIRPMHIGRLLFLRKIRKITSKTLKEQVTRLVESSDMLKHDAQKFANEIMQDIHFPKPQDDAIVLIITASPNIYMKYICEELKCELLCSNFIQNEYVEMYGEIKAHYLHSFYPTTEYKYIYAESDSESDMCWMQTFQEYNLINNRL